MLPETRERRTAPCGAVRAAYRKGRSGGFCLVGKLRGGELRRGLARLGYAWPAWDHERSERSDCDDPGTDEQGRVHPVDEVLARAVAADVGEDRGEHRHPEHTAQLADCVVGAGR